LLDDLRRQQQSSSLYKQQRAAVEESLYQKIKAIGEDKNHYKAEMSRLQLESERFQEENARLRKNQTTLDVEILKTRQGSQQALDLESSAATSKIELLKAEITEWKDRVGSQRDLETQKTKLEAACKKLEMRLAVAEEQNRTMSKRLTQLMNDGGSGTKPQSPNQPKIRLFLDSVAKTHETELTQLRDARDTLLKQYRSLEDAYRQLQLARDAERKEFVNRQRSLVTLVHEQVPTRLLDDGISNDPRLGKMPWESASVDSRTSGRTSPGSSDAGRADGIPEGISLPPTGALPPIPMGYSAVPQFRAGPSTSPVDAQNPFSSVLPRRTTNSTTNSTGSNSKPGKIKPNSEIRIYGRCYSQF
jgi:hypothetical protein